MKVLDTSAIFRSSMDFTEGGYIITNGVLSELIDDDVKEIIDLAIGNNHIKVVSPGEKHVKKAEDKAKETGDYSSLSKVDLELIAAALETGASVVSDDYAVQNLAAHLGIKFEATSQDGIKRKLSWEKVCTGCGSKYAADYPGDCLICGHEIRRRPVH
ncbi:MAG: DNA-binding protein [Candidatus Altiarchaeota archaeon]